MKKLICVVALATMLAAAPATYAEVATYNHVLTEESFTSSNFATGVVDGSGVFGSDTLKKIPYMWGTPGSKNDKLYVKDIGLDETHGESLVLQKGNGEGEQTGGSSWMGFVVGKKTGDTSYTRCNTACVMEFDFMSKGTFNSSPIERVDMFLRGSVPNNGATYTNANYIYIQNNRFTVTQATGSNKDISYDKGVWNKVRYEVDFVNGTFEFSVYGNDGSLKGTKTGNLQSSIVSLAQLRFSFAMQNGLGDTGVEKYIAIDNVKLTYIDYVPEVTKTYTVDGDTVTEITGAAPIDKNKLRFELDAPLRAVPVEGIDVKVTGLEEEFYEKVKSVTLDNTGKLLDIELYRPIQSGCTYTISLNENAKTSYDVGMGTTIEIGGSDVTYTTVEKGMNTQSKPVDVSDVTFAPTSDGIQGTVNIVNNEAEAKDVYLVTAVYSGDEMKKTSVEKITVPVGGATPQTPAYTLGTGERIEVYVWDSLEGPASIPSRFYIYK